MIERGREKEGVNGVRDRENGEGGRVRGVIKIERRDSWRECIGLYDLAIA